MGVNIEVQSLLITIEDEIQTMKMVLETPQQNGVVEGVDYREIFSLAVKMTIVRKVLGIVITNYFTLEQLVVKISFLHDDFDEYIYIV